MTQTASPVKKEAGNNQMGNHRAKMAMLLLGKPVGREREARGGASLARKARRAGEKRQERKKGKVMWEDKAVWSHQEKQEKKLRGLEGGVGLKE